jgi:HlyD family secretion protein
LTACQKTKEASFPIPTAQVKRSSFEVNAEATGKIEPINVIDIKSKAGGQITRMPVESGTHVTKGDTIVDLDKRDVQSSLDQADADYKIAQKRLDNSKTVNDRNQELFKAHVITQAEKETGELDIQSQSTNLLKARAALELAQLRFNDATIVAPQEGTILDKKVSMGTVIASASSSASGGTTLVTMADLTHVRARVLVSETDIGKVLQNMATKVLVDAYPNRPFEGVVEKMEPQAVVDQNVTMFPVLVNLDNSEGALMPGMNGEVSILVDQKRNVLTIPLDAFRLSNEARTVAEMFGSTAEKVDSVAKAGLARPSANIAPVTDDSATQVPVGRGGDSASGRGNNRNGGQGGGQGGQGAQGAGRGRSGGLPTVTDGDCNAVTAALAKKPGVQDQIDSLSATRSIPGADFTAISNQTNALYASAGVNPQVAAACRIRSMGARGGGAGGGRGGRGGRGGGRGGGGGAPMGGTLGTRNNGLGVRGQGLASQGIVFVQIGIDTTVKPPKPRFEPRFVKLGAQNYDVAEVTDGLKEGEVVALMAAAKIEVQRRQAADKQKANTSLIPGMNQGRGMPGMGGPTDRGAGGPGGGGPGGAGGGGGGGGGGGRGGRGG